MRILRTDRLSPVQPPVARVGSSWNCQGMDLSPETRSSQQTQLGIGRNHRASRLHSVGGDQTVERIAVHVWKFARAIDEQFVQRQVFDLEKGAAGWGPLFRRLGKRELSGAMFHHHCHRLDRRFQFPQRNRHRSTHLQKHPEPNLRTTSVLANISSPPKKTGKGNQP
jgi:hypothetical protein